MHIGKREERKARKDHQCDLCLRTIEKGSRYNTTFHVGDYPYRWKSHTECDILCDRIFREYAYDMSNEGVNNDDLWEWLNSMAHPKWFQPFDSVETVVYWRLTGNTLPER